jgi:uncharacterized protein (TIGR03437 family)
MFIADRTNHKIRKVATDGRISTFAGTGASGFSGDDGPATQARLTGPTSIAFDTAGNVLISDSGNNCIRRVNLQGTITTIVGDRRLIYAGDGQPALLASLSLPRGIAMDAAGTLYIAEDVIGRIRRVSGGIVSTYVGNGLLRAFPDGTPATQGYLNGPRGVFLGPGRRLYIADGEGGYIRVVDPDGRMRTVAGRGGAGQSGDGGPAIDALINPVSITGDDAGNLYFSSGGNYVRRISPTGIITTVAGNGLTAYAGDGSPATNFPVNNASGLALDRAGNLYIADSNNHRIRRLSPDGTISTVVGTGVAGFSGDGGPASQARLRGPTGVAIDARGVIYIADRENQVIRRIDASGVISTVAGRQGRLGFSGDGGPALQAEFRNPREVSVGPDGSIFVTDNGNHRIRRIDPAGMITSFAGNGQPRFAGDGGFATSGSLGSPWATAIGPDGAAYIADRNNNRVRIVSSVQASFQSSPSSLTFTAPSNGMPTAPATLQLTSSLAGLPFTVRLTDGDWLRLTPRSGVMPAVLELSADPTRLSPGSYRATVAIESPLATPPSRNVTVSLVIEQANPPRLTMGSAGIAFAFSQGAAAESRALRLSNAGSGTLDLSVSAATSTGGEWLAASPDSGSVSATSPLSLNVTANPGALPAGTYAGRIQARSAATNETVSVPVTMSISAVPQSILLSQTGLTFVAVAGGGTPPPQTLEILNFGQGQMGWTALSSTLSGGNAWLTVTPTEGVSPGFSAGVPVQVEVNPAGLSPGEYYGQIEVNSPSAGNSPQASSIVLNLLPPGSNPGPMVQPTGLVFVGVAGGSSPSSQTVTVSNVSESPVSFSSGRVTLDGRTWFVSAPSDAVVNPGQPLRIVVQADVAGLTAGVRRGALTLVFSDGSIRTVSLLLVVTAASPSTASRAADGCAPRQLLPVFAMLGEQFSVTAGWPSPVEVRVVDDCGNPLESGSVGLTFSNGDPPLSLSSLKAGRWSGTWQARNTAAAQISVSASAANPDANLTGSVQVTGGLRTTADPPVVSPGAIVSAASFAPQAPLAPGSFVSIFGARLANGLFLSSSLPLETQLEGVSATIAGRRLPLLFASGGQINAQIPFGIPFNTAHQVVVRRGNSLAVPEAITIAATQPAIFTKDQSGQGQGAIVDPNFRLVEPGNEARPGNVIVIYCSGLGATDPPVASGAAAPASPLAAVTNPVTLTIGGAPSQVLFAGLAPGFAGLYQVNAIVPAGVPAGAAVPVILTSAGQSSPPVTIAIQ